MPFFKTKHMNRFKLILIFMIIHSVSSFGQKGMSFDLKDFSKKQLLAEWLCNYDAIAWWTSDSLMKQDSQELQRLGKDWFCYQTSDNNWHAVYGKYDNNQFDLVFHYIVDKNNNVSRIYETVDSSKLNTHSRALITANKQMQSLKDSVNVLFNQYIKQNEDKTFTVWIFPAFQPSNLAVYGGEFIYTIDHTGNNVLKTEGYYQGQFRGFEVGKPREIWLNYRELENPTLGSVFFVWYYKSYFTSIKIDNKDFVSSTIKNDDGSYSWIHVEKEEKK